MNLDKITQIEAEAAAVRAAVETLRRASATQVEADVTALRERLRAQVAQLSALDLGRVTERLKEAALAVAEHKAEVETLRQQLADTRQEEQHQRATLLASQVPQNQQEEQAAHAHRRSWIQHYLEHGETDKAYELGWDGEATDESEDGGEEGQNEGEEEAALGERARRIMWIQHFLDRGETDKAFELGWDGFIVEEAASNYDHDGSGGDGGINDVFEDEDDEEEEAQKKAVVVPASHDRPTRGSRLVCWWVGGVAYGFGLVWFANQMGLLSLLPLPPSSSHPPSSPPPSQPPLPLSPSPPPPYHSSPPPPSGTQTLPPRPPRPQPPSPSLLPPPSPSAPPPSPPPPPNSPSPSPAPSPLGPSPPASPPLPTLLDEPGSPLLWLPFFLFAAAGPLVAWYKRCCREPNANGGHLSGHQPFYKILVGGRGVGSKPSMAPPRHAPPPQPTEVDRMGTAPVRQLPSLDSKLQEAARLAAQQMMQPPPLPSPQPPQPPPKPQPPQPLSPPPPQRPRGSMHVVPDGRVRRSIESIAAAEAAARTRAAPTTMLVGGGGVGSGEDAIARRLFDQFDTDRSGAIDADELRQLCLVLGDPLGPDTHGILMRRLDADGDGLITFEEFVSFWDAIEEGGRTPGVVAAVAVEGVAAAATSATPDPTGKANTERARRQQEAQQRSAQSSLERAAAARERAAQARERAAAQVLAAVQVRERAAEVRQRSAERGRQSASQQAKTMADYALSSASRRNLV